MTLTELDDDTFDADAAVRLLTRQMGVATLTGFGLDERTQAVRAAGACLKYA